MNTPRAAIGARFGAAAPHYEAHAQIQAGVAERLAARIAALPLPPRTRVLEIGCGTGLLTRALAPHLPDAHWTLSDLAPGMLDRLDSGPIPPTQQQRILLDGEYPDALGPGHYDLICSSLAVQWFGDLNAGLGRLIRLLAPGGHLAITTLTTDTFREWRAAHEAVGESAATPYYPPTQAIWPDAPGLNGEILAWRVEQPFPDGLAFLRGLRAIGATTPARSHTPLSPGGLRRVLRHFQDQGCRVTYHVAQCIWRTPEPRHARQTEPSDRISVSVPRHSPTRTHD